MIFLKMTAEFPNTIADFIGDNVNDIAGNCSDLLESFVATLSASVMIAVTLYETNGESVGDTIFGSTTLFPIVLAGCGLLGCVLGLGFCNIKKMGDNPSKELDLSTWISAGCTVVFGGIASYLLFRSVPANDFALYGFKLGWASPWVSAIMGIVSGVAIGIITEYYTSTDYKPTGSLPRSVKKVKPL